MYRPFLGKCSDALNRLPCLQLKFPYTVYINWYDYFGVKCSEDQGLAASGAIEAVRGPVCV